MRQGNVLAYGLLAGVVVGGVSPAALSRDEHAVVFRDTFDDARAWTSAASPFVDAAAAQAEAGTLRWSASFAESAGAAVLRRAVDVQLPRSFRVRLRLRGPVPGATLELRLVGSTPGAVAVATHDGPDVGPGWITPVLERWDFVPPPGQGLPPRLSAIEVRVQSTQTGAIELTLDDIAIEPLPEPVRADAAVRVRTSSVGEGTTARETLGGDGSLRWRSDPADRTPTVELDFGGVRELGTVALGWALSSPREVRIERRDEQGAWSLAGQLTTSNGGVDVICVGPARATGLRLTMIPDQGEGIDLDVIELGRAETAVTPWALFEALAVRGIGASWPLQARGAPVRWTAAGDAEGGANEILLDAHGKIEHRAGGFTLEPMLSIGRRIADPMSNPESPMLVRPPLPLPMARLTWASLNIDTLAFPASVRGTPATLVRTRVRNQSPVSFQGSLSVAVRPLQVLPPVERSPIAKGGWSPVRSVRPVQGGVIVNESVQVRGLTPPTSTSASTLADIDVGEWRDIRVTPPLEEAQDDDGFASALMEFPVDSLANSTVDVWYAVIDSADTSVALLDAAAAEAALEAHLSGWAARLETHSVAISGGVQPIADSIKTALGHILMNRDGPALCNGPRGGAWAVTYEAKRVALALLAFGFEREAVEYADWLASLQHESGAIPGRASPSVIDRSDAAAATASYLAIVRACAEFAGDDAMVARHAPHVARAAAYIAEQPLPIIDESAEAGWPVEIELSFARSVAVAAGISDAAWLLEHAGRAEDAARMSALVAPRQADVTAALVAASSASSDRWLPGSSASSAIEPALAPMLVEGGWPDAITPRAGVMTTLQESAAKVIEGDASVTSEWIRVAGALVRRGERGAAVSVLGTLLNRRAPVGWAQWHRSFQPPTIRAAALGDAPDSLAAAEFVLAMRDMLVLDDGVLDRRLVVAPGVPAEWVQTAPGLSVRDLRTRFGTLSYTLAGDANEWVLKIEALRDGAPAALLVPRGKQVVSATIDNEPAAVREGLVAIPRTPATVWLRFGN